MRVLVLWFPEFVVDVERARLRAPADTPIVVGGQADGPGVVIAACRAARAAGVVPGMPLAEAASRCPGALFVPGILDHYAEAASLLDEEIRRQCASVAWRRLDEAVITEAGVRDGIGSLAVVAESLTTRITSGLALAVAAGVADSEVAARVAARLASPSGLLHVLPGYDVRFLKGLPVRCAPDLPDDYVHGLRAAGVETLGELAAMEPALAQSVLGDRAPSWQLAAAGVDPASSQPTDVPRSVTRVRDTLEVLTLDDLRRALDQTASEVADRVRQLGLRAEAVTVRALCSSGRVRSRSATLRAGDGGDTDLAASVRALAPQLWRYGQVPHRISVVATRLSAEEAQRPLFAGAGTGIGRGARRTSDSARALERRRARWRAHAS